MSSSKKKKARRWQENNQDFRSNGYNNYITGYVSESTGYISESRNNYVEEKKCNSFTKRKILVPKNKEQQDYIDSIEDYDLTICNAVSGTGKTYVAVGMACRYLLDEKISKIVICKPNVQCGPDMGHLPGDISSKVAPFMSHFTEVLDEFLTPQTVREYIAAKIIKFEPLQSMRGSDIKNSMIILDEMQNATYKQLKMLATRPSEGSKAIFLGDMAQSDLGEFNTKEITERFFDKIKNSKYINFVELNSRQVIRSRLARDIANLCD